MGGYVAAARQLKAELPSVSFRVPGFLYIPSPSAVPRSEVEAWEREGVIEYLGHSDDMLPLDADADCVVVAGDDRAKLRVGSVNPPRTC